MSTTPRTDAVWADKKQNILEHARQLEDLRDEFLPRKKRKPYRCLDMMCGATDCWTCYPDQREHQDEDEP